MIHLRFSPPFSDWRRAARWAVSSIQLPRVMQKPQRGKGVGRHQHHFVSRRKQFDSMNSTLQLGWFLRRWEPVTAPFQRARLPHAPEWCADESLDLLARTAPLARSLHRRSCCIIAHPARRISPLSGHAQHRNRAKCGRSPFPRADARTTAAHTHMSSRGTRPPHPLSACAVLRRVNDHGARCFDLVAAASRRLNVGPLWRHRGRSSVRRVPSPNLPVRHPSSPRPRTQAGARASEHLHVGPDLSRGRPWESKQRGNAKTGCPRCLAATRLWHGTLLGVLHVARTSGVAFPSVLERLSNTPARLQEASPWLCEGMARSWAPSGTSVPVTSRFPS